jgi:hypothetical protein
MNNDDLRIIDFLKGYLNKGEISIYKTNEFEKIQPNFFIDRNYHCIYEFVDISSDYSESLIEYSKSLYLFFIGKSIYIAYDMKAKNEFNLLLTGLKKIKNE